MLCALLILSITGCSPQHNRLQRLVTDCLDNSGETYCTSCPWPRTDSGCIADTPCGLTTEIWREDLHYVAIRDRKMCGCADSGFVHGLAIPRALVPGVEAVNRPNGIWKFAWQTALDRGIPPEEISLAINPQWDRSENQMHIHIARLRATVAPGLGSPVKDLGAVWKTAGEIAVQRGWADYGVMVTSDGKEGFMVVVSAESPEDLYQLARCPKK
jgi:CDP-diacylglycerol pyrophosphatase